MICDFDCKIFNTNKFNELNTVDEDLFFRETLRDDLEILDRCSIHRLVCYIRHDEDQNVNNTLRRVVEMEKFIKRSTQKDILKKFRINVYPKIFLSRDCPYIKNISKLAVGNSERLFIDLPLISSPEYVDDAMNKILYNCKLIPVFTEFQNYNLFYPQDVIDKLIRIRDASFQFSIFKINQADNIDLVKKIIKNGNTVLLGTGVDHNVLNEKEIVKNVMLLKKNLQVSVYQDILVNSGRLFN